jgi:hypothetical protein
MRLIAVAFIAFVVAGEASAQTIHYARVVPGSPRQLWVIGRDLWVGSDQIHDAKTNTVRLSINGVSCEFRLLRGAAHRDNDGMEANRCWPYAQCFQIPSSVTPGEKEIEHFRNDGKVTQFKVDVPWPAESISKPSPSGSVEEHGIPFVVKAGEALDLGGATIYPSASFTQETFVTLMDGAELRNARVIVHRDSPQTIRNALRLVGNRHLLINVQVINEQEGDDRAIHMTSSSGSTFVNVFTQGARCWESEPRETPQQNTWVRCESTGLRGGRHGLIGRGMIGRQNLILWGSWHCLDRGPTGSQYGSPTDQCVFFECQQWNTGRHLAIQKDDFRDTGASEGLLFENKDCVCLPAKCGGNILMVTARPAEDRGVLIDDRDFLKPGYHLCLIEKKVWARIVEVKRHSKYERVVVCDRQLPIGDFTARIGNAMVECSILRCQFQNGRAGVFLFGQTCDVAVVQCDFLDLLQGNIVKLERTRSGEESFHWGLQTPFCTVWRSGNKLIRDYTP